MIVMEFKQTKEVTLLGPLDFSIPGRVCRVNFLPAFLLVVQDCKGAQAVPAINQSGRCASEVEQALDEKRYASWRGSILPEPTLPRGESGSGWRFANVR